MTDESTTPDLVELVRAGADAFNRRDLDAGMCFFAPDAVYDTSSVGIGTFEGADAIRRHLGEWFDNYEEYEFRLEEVHDLGNGVTFEVVRHHGRVAASDAAVQERWSYTGLWEAGVISRMIVRADIDEARAAAERLAKERAGD
jgi:ketosteroid isomerase-like protein